MCGLGTLRHENLYFVDMMEETEVTMYNQWQDSVSDLEWER